jgi:predicted DNA-binding transcriptional regulator YafY
MIDEDLHALTTRTGSPDAEGWLSLSLTFGSREQALAVMFGMGAGVELMEPHEMRDSLVQGALEIAASYAPRSSGPPPL